MSEKDGLIDGERLEVFKGYQPKARLSDKEPSPPQQPRKGKTMAIKPIVPSPLGDNPFAGIRSYAEQDKQTRRIMVVECAIYLLNSEVKSTSKSICDLQRSSRKVSESGRVTHEGDEDANIIKKYADWIEDALIVNSPFEPLDKNA